MEKGSKIDHANGYSTIPPGSEYQPPYPPTPNSEPRKPAKSNNSIAAAAVAATTHFSTTTGKLRHTTRRWSAEEDERLTQLVANAPDFHKISWAELSSQMENRSAKQCRERYINSLKPEVKKGLWTEDEDENILRLQSVLGNQWSKIAAMLPGRSDNDVKNRWHSKMRSKAAKRKGSVDDQGGEASGINAKYASVNTMHPTKQERKRSKRTAPVVVTEAVKSNNTHHLAMAPASSNGTTSLPQGHAKSNYEQMYGEYCNTQAPAYNGIRPSNTINTLSESEVSLCHQLLNLQRTLQQKPDAHQPPPSHFQTAAARYHYNEEEDNCDDYLFEHISMKSREQAAETKNGSSRSDYDNGIRAGQKEDVAATKAGCKVSKKAARPEKPTDKSSAEKRKGVNPSKKQTQSSLHSPSGASGDPKLLRGIRHPGMHDCLIGRGGGTNHHPGNIKYRLIINSKKIAYRNSKRECKPLLAMQIVKDWRKMDPPGRFLKLNEDTGLWDDIGDEAARVKCSQTLREKKESKLRLST